MQNGPNPDRPDPIKPDKLGVRMPSKAPGIKPQKDGLMRPEVTK